MSSGAGELAEPRAPIPIEGSYKLFNERDIAEFIGGVGVVPFIKDLHDEIEAVYTGAELSGAPRSNMLRAEEDGFATMEMMTCSGSDYTIFKRIGSDPGREAKGWSTVYGDMYCVEAGTGQIRLLCGATYLTALRTATTSALVLNKLKPELETLSVVGAGVQGISHAFAIAALSPNIKRIVLRDIDLSKARKEADELEAVIAINLGSQRSSTIEAMAVPEDDSRVESESDAIVTATFGLPDKSPVLSPTDLRPGIVIAAVGADMVGKRELNPAIYRQAKFVTDELRQSLYEGELQQAARELGITGEDIDGLGFADYHGSLARGRAIGITELLADPDTFTDRPEEMTIYDSTGFSGQDLAAARLMLRLLKKYGYPQDPTFNESPGMTLAESLGRG